MYTLDELQSRHSVRAYSPNTIPEDIRNKLRAEATLINSREAGLNFRIVFDNGEPFNGFTRSYGFFKGVSNYLVPIIDPSFLNAEERAGYFGEQFVMAALRLGLGSCIVGGTFSSSHVAERLEVYEKIPFLISFGYPASKLPWTQKMFGFKKNRPSGRSFFIGAEDEYLEACRLLPSLPEALEAVACAPSALNKRPVRIALQKNENGNNLIAYTDTDGKFSAIDLGVAKFNFASVAGGEWEWGQKAPFLPE